MSSAIRTGLYKGMREKGLESWYSNDMVKHWRIALHIFQSCREMVRRNDMPVYAKVRFWSSKNPSAQDGLPSSSGSNDVKDSFDSWETFVLILISIAWKIWLRPLDNPWGFLSLNVRLQITSSLHFQSVPSRYADVDWLAVPWHSHRMSYYQGILKAYQHALLITNELEKGVLIHPLSLHRVFCPWLDSRICQILLQDLSYIILELRGIVFSHSADQI